MSLPTAERMVDDWSRYVRYRMLQGKSPESTAGHLVRFEAQSLAQPYPTRARDPKQLGVTPLRRQRRQIPSGSELKRAPLAQQGRIERIRKAIARRPELRSAIGGTPSRAWIANQIAELDRVPSERALVTMLADRRLALSRRVKRLMANPPPTPQPTFEPIHTATQRMRELKRNPKKRRSVRATKAPHPPARRRARAGKIIVSERGHPFKVCPRATRPEALMFPRDLLTSRRSVNKDAIAHSGNVYTARSAIAWTRKHTNFPIREVEETKNFIRIRVAPKELFVKGSFRNIPMSERYGVRMIIACPRFEVLAGGKGRAPKREQRRVAADY